MIVLLAVLAGLAAGALAVMTWAWWRMRCAVLRLIDENDVLAGQRDALLAEEGLTLDQYELLQHAGRN